MCNSIEELGVGLLSTRYLGFRNLRLVVQLQRSTPIPTILVVLVSTSAVKVRTHQLSAKAGVAV